MTVYPVNGIDTCSFPYKVQSEYQTPYLMAHLQIPKHDTQVEKRIYEIPFFKKISFSIKWRASQCPIPCRRRTAARTTQSSSKSSESARKRRKRSRNSQTKIIHCCQVARLSTAIKWPNPSRSNFEHFFRRINLDIFRKEVNLEKKTWIQVLFWLLWGP